MNEAKAEPAVVHAVIQITRKATGKVEEYTITGTPVKQPEPAQEPQKES